MILIEHNGERQLVTSLDGYPGAKIIAENVAHPAHDHHRWDEKRGRWQEDTEAKAAADLRAVYEAIPKAELVARLIECERAIAALTKPNA